MNAKINTEFMRMINALEVPFTANSNGRLQMTAYDLRYLKDSDDCASVRKLLPNCVLAFVDIYPSIISYLNKTFPSLTVSNIQEFKVKKHSNKELWKNIQSFENKMIKVEGGYLNEQVLAKINEVFTTSLCKAEYKFRIHDNAINNYDWKKNCYQLHQNADGWITFTKDLQDNTISNDETNEMGEVLMGNDIEYEFHLCNRLIKRLFGEGNYDHRENFYYSYERKMLWASDDDIDRLYEQIHNNCCTNEFSLTHQELSVGIDFLWKKQSLGEVLTELSSKYPFIEFSIRKSHVCTFDIQIDNLLEQAI